MMTVSSENGLQKSHLYEQVADLLEQQILTNHDDGSRLPSEQQLAEQYQVSRTIIRESLKLLKARGLIDSRTGSGAFVTKPEAQNLADVVYRIVRMEQISYVSVFDMRTILETESASLAARYASENELLGMNTFLDKLKRPNLSPKERADYDFGFHYAISQASRNPLLALMTEAIGNVFREIVHKTFTLPGGLDDSIVRHNLILHTLQDHDEAAARKAVLEHLEKSKQNYVEYLQDHPDEVFP